MLDKNCDQGMEQWPGYSKAEWLVKDIFGPLSVIRHATVVKQDQSNTMWLMEKLKGKILDLSTFSWFR